MKWYTEGIDLKYDGEIEDFREMDFDLIPLPKSFIVLNQPISWRYFQEFVNNALAYDLNFEFKNLILPKEEIDYGNATVLINNSRVNAPFSCGKLRTTTPISTQFNNKIKCTSLTINCGPLDGSQYPNCNNITIGIKVKDFHEIMNFNNVDSLAFTHPTSMTFSGIEKIGHDIKSLFFSPSNNFKYGLPYLMLVDGLRKISYLKDDEFSEVYDYINDLLASGKRGWHGVLALFNYLMERGLTDLASLK